MSEKITGVKVTLSTGKVVLLRSLKIAHFELAIKAVGNRGKGNDMLQQVMTNKELAKILLYSIDGKVMAGADSEDLDAIFSIAEYQQVQRVIGEMAGAVSGEGGVDFSPKIESVLCGGK